MKTVSIINYKGGVGKTTITANLAAELANRGLRILMLDLDPQSSLTFSLIKAEDWKEKYAKTRTIKSWYDGIEKGKSISLQDLILTPEIANSAISGKGKLDLICSHLGLLNVDLELATELGGATLKQAKQKFLKVYRRLAIGLSGLPKDSYHLVLIDCPPNFNIVTRNAIVASDRILIPAKPDYLSTLGIDYLIGNLKNLVADYNEYAKIDDGEDVPPINPTILAVVFTMVQYYAEQPIAALRPYMQQVDELGVKVFSSQIRENKSLLSDAPEIGLPAILKHAPNEVQQRVIEEMKEFATEFAENLELSGG